MKRLSRLSVAFVFLSMSMGTACAADLSGTWIMTVKSELGNGTPSFVLKQVGEKLTGTYKGQLGEQAITGMVAGKEVTIKYTGATQGVSLDVTYAGTVDGDSMTGKVTFGEYGEGTFTGKKQ